MKFTKEEMKILTRVATEARDNAYCPYSNHPVGVALVTDKGMVFPGSNVEIAHYKGVCAEASAISNMVTAGERKIAAVVVIGPAMEYLCTPCGDCRQRLREFAAPGMKVYSLWKDGKLGATTDFTKLLPMSFGPENLAEVGSGPMKNKKRKKAKKK